MIFVHVKTLEDRTFELVVDKTDTINSLKYRVHELGGPEVERQTFIRAGEKYTDNQRLEELGFVDSHEPIVIHMVTYQDTIGTIDVRKDGEIIMVTKWDYSKLDNMVMHLKREVITKLELPHSTLRKVQCHLNGLKMENNESLRSYFQKEQSEHLTVDVSI